MIIEKRLYGHDVKVFADRPSNVYEMLVNAAEKFPTKEALIKDHIRLNYQELKEQVDTVASNLLQKQIKKGDRIALLLGNEIEFALTVLACAKIGAIFVPLNTKLTARDLIYMLTDSGAKMLITNSTLAEPLEDWLTGNGYTPSCMLIDEHQPLKNMYSFHDELLNDHPKSETPYQAPSETDTLYIMYTSGTTGLPKGAVGSHINIIHSSLNYKHVLKTNHHTRTLIAVPLFHVTGLIGQLFHVILVGGTNVLMDRYRTEPFIELLVSEKINFMFNVPTIYIMLMSTPFFKTFSYGYVRTVAYGGAPMSKETIKDLKTYFPNASLHNAYGATETASPATIMPESYPIEKSSSVGLPVPVGDLKIVNQDGEDCGPAEIGELYIKGPMVVKGYWNNKEANASSFIDGYWKSGDIAYIDQDGFVYIMDRIKDMINRGGENIYSIEVENVLYAHPKILEASVVGVKDKLYGEEVKAYIVKKPDVELTAEEVVAFAREHLSKFKVPRYVEFIKEFPRNPGGKIIKKKLAEMSKDQEKKI
ncbi:class I adenylate-forming enzyme family protein [Bacillus seohaeanensis]|uniref:Class I adenylate-forming enzyme family protein n=1 Tax=Bacillus seohaeanensis TaxID=284580 RepID=A0ABW5RML8_9BACI